MANTEQIEAKLCAYVDGELDAAGRAEIEQHLAANPQHRQLLAELMEQRSYLRDLPRERAPEDLIDSVQSQLERSVLLDGGAASPAVAGRISHWPQMLALAAVLFLAVGLASVIYFVLPDQSKQLRNYAVLPATTAPAEGMATGTPATGPAFALKAGAPSAPAAPSLDRTLAKAGGGAMTDERKSAKLALTPPPAAAPTTPAYADKPYAGKQASDIFANNAGQNAPADAMRNRDNKLASNVMFEQLPLDRETEQRVTQAPGCPENAYLVVVASADPSATDRQVTGYLEQNNIRWDDASEPMPAPLGAKKDAVYPSKMQSPRMELRDKLAPAAKGELVAQNLADADKSKTAPATKEEADSLKSSTDVGAVAVAPPGTPSPATPSPSAIPSIEPPSGAGGFASAGPAPATQPQGQPSAQPLAQAPAQPSAQSSPPSQSIAQQQLQPAGQVRVDQLTLQSQQAGGNAGSRLIVARNLTQDQVADLYNCVAANNGGRVGNYRRSGSFITPTTVPVSFAAMQNGASQVIGGSLALQQPSFGSGGAAQVQKELTGLGEANAATTAPATQPASEVATRLPATPAAPPAAARGAQTPSSQPATTSPVTTIVTTIVAAPTTQLVGADAIAAQAAPTTAPADERVDVVIVVKSDLSDASRGQVFQLESPPASNVSTPAAAQSAAPAATHQTTTRP